MNTSKRPISVTIIAALYLAVGAGGFAVHFRELLAHHPDAVGIELTELTGVLCGVFCSGDKLGALASACLDRVPRGPERLSRDP
jgi:hypothetical protein